MLINRQRPVDRYTAQNQAEKERNGKPMTDPYEDMVPADYEHGGPVSPRACSLSFTDLSDG